MKKLLVTTVAIFFLSVSEAQNSKLRFDAMMGINQSTGALNAENKQGGRFAAAMRYILNNNSSFTILHVGYDFFHITDKISTLPEMENAGGAKNLTFMSGYSHHLFNIVSRNEIIKIHCTTNIGIGRIGHNSTDRITKFGINPVLSFEPFHETFADFGYFNFWGGTKKTNYCNFALRFSFGR